LTTLACALALGGAIAPAYASAAVIPVPGPTVFNPLKDLVDPGDVVKLSDEKRVTRWAYANTRSPIRSAPSTKARAITRLRYFNEDKQPEVYLVLSGTVDAAGDQWLRVRIPARPNGQKGWVPVDMLSQLHVVRTQLIINRTLTRATVRPCAAASSSSRTGSSRFARRRRPRSTSGERPGGAGRCLSCSTGLCAAWLSASGLCAWLAGGGGPLSGVIAARLCTTGL